VKFLELTLQNFGPYRGKQVINLRPEKDGNPCPIILLGGMNGGGKTTLMDAIRLVLYGQRALCSTRGNLSYSDFLNQCINHQTPAWEDTRIELLFEHLQNGQPQTKKVVRHWKQLPKDAKDNLGIISGEWLDEALASNWDAFIEDLLPIGISNLFLFDGEQVKELAEQDTPPPIVIEAIQSLLGLELVDRLAIDLNILVNRKRKQIAGTKELAALEEIEAKIQEYNQEREAQKQEREALKQKLIEAEDNHRDAYNKFLSEGGKIAGEKNRIEKQLNEVLDRSQKQRDELCQLAGGTLPLALIEPLLHQAEIQGEKELRAATASVAQEVIKERDRRMISYLKNLQLSPKKLEQIQVFLESENQKLSDDAANSADLWLGIDDEILKKLNVMLNYQLPGVIDQAKDKLEKLSQTEEEIATKESKIAAAAAPEIYQQLQQQVTKTDEEKFKQKVAWETCDRQCRELEIAIAQMGKKLASYGDELMKRKNTDRILNSAINVQATLKLYREKLTLKKLNKLELEVTECFRYLLHKSNLVHRVIIDTHTYKLSLFDHEVSKQRLSAGEKQLLAIAFLWGLARVSGKQLPVAIDTPLGRLDSSHRSNLIERYFPSASHQVILLSTDTEIGKNEVENLRKQSAIAREYLLKYNSKERQTIVEDGYFW
jgi:DNA sulfur modification protein DndD